MRVCWAGCVNNVCWSRPGSRRGRVLDDIPMYSLNRSSSSLASVSSVEENSPGGMRQV